ncbi:MAG TPA: hypothetical protein VFN24_13365 [Microbacterium sp.]|nr:hypothetical protein [Microbacterium sp.]
MAPAAVLLLLGLNAGLLLMGVPMPVPTEALPEMHAPLLVFGFVGTLISLERAVALRAAWAYSAPILFAVGAIAVLLPFSPLVGKVLITLGAVAHCAQYFAIWRRQPMTATAVQGTGAVIAVTAGVAWCGGVQPAWLVPQLAAFLVLTIAGERLELARLASPGRFAENLLLWLGVGLAASALLSLTMPVVAVPLAGIALLAIVAWLGRYDVARRMLRQPGLPKFVAVCLLAGYAWLAVAGVGWLLGGPQTDGPLFDATTHAVFLGFVITMIMAHAPIILPAVLRVRIPYHPVLYLPVALLQLSLLVRVIVGDAWGSVLGLQLSGFGAAIAMVLFGVTAVVLSVREGAAERRAKKEKENETRVAA